MISKIKSFGGKLFIFFLIIGIQPLLFMTAAAYINTNQMISEINSSIMKCKNRREFIRFISGNF